MKITEYINKAVESLIGLRLIENKLKVIAQVFGFAKKETIYKLKRGIKLVVPSDKRDRTALITLKEIFVDGVYETGKKDAKVILDIGANIGIYSLYACTNNEKAKVYAFEPDEHNFIQIKNNAKVNGLSDRIIPFKIAVSDKNGFISFYNDPLTSRGHSTVFHKGSEIKVKAVTLKDIFSDLKIAKCDILKMDIEGAEYGVIYNCPEEILNKIDRIMVEYHKGLDKNNYNREGIITFLSKKGFKPKRDKENVLYFTRN